jgi:hypothetical protein
MEWWEARAPGAHAAFAARINQLPAPPPIAETPHTG